MALSFARQKPSDKALVSKSKSSIQRTAIKGGGNNIAARINSIVALAETKLGHHKDDYIIIRDPDELYDYMKETKQNEEGAIDTETKGLNPLTDSIVGACIYTPTRKAAYVPINHVSYITGARSSKQMTAEQVAKIMSEFYKDIRWDMHNATFDIRVMRKWLGLDFDCYWDTQLGANCIDEQGSHTLKDLHFAHCNSTDKEAVLYGSLFNGITFDLVPINTAYLYAAGDAIKTYELKEWERSILETPEYEGPYNTFRHIEMPVVKVVCNMEDRGVTLDTEVSNNLKDKYHALQDEKIAQINKVLHMYDDLIDTYKMKHVDAKLDSPINIRSTTQLAILFYDILKLESPDKKHPRGTGEDILSEFAKGKHKDLCTAILDMRSVDKLLSTYIDKMPKIVLPDGRIHCSYNQYGAATGRFSSANPNMQNIPSHNKDIRKMFKAQDGYVLIGSDFSQQEPMTCAHLSQDKKMIQAFKDGKDIYATIAALSFDKPYEECLEFRPDGTTNPAGKDRRTQAKSIVLGILYGRSIPSIAEQLSCSVQKAQEIYDKVLTSFEGLANFIKESETQARNNGYVSTAWGRRRHIPDMMLPDYEFSYTSNNLVNFDPLSFSNDVVSEVPRALQAKYTKLLSKAKYKKERDDIMYQASQEGIKIKDNTYIISEAQRQCVNSRVQGTAADITKLAMIDIDNDERMRELDFHLLIQVHDEVIGECPIENAKEAKERLSYLMRTAPTELIDLPFKCDCEVTINWYGETVEV